jgi:predicted dehydrogenase
MADARLCAVVDMNLNNLTSLDQEGNLSLRGPEVRLDGVNLHTELGPILAAPDIDVVDICLPVRFHYEWAMQALQAGKHVLLEKPMVLDPAQGRRLIDLARANGRILMVAHVVRFMPAYRTLRTIRKDGRFGPLELIVLQRWAGQPDWGMWKETEGRRSSGGGLFDMLIHDVDMVNWLMGRPSRIHSRMFAGGVSDHDFVNAVWTFDDGSEAILTGGFAFHSRLPFESKFLARFHSATVAFDSARPDILVVADDHRCELTTLDMDPLTGFRGEIEYFVGCVKSHCWPEECTPESSLEAVQLALEHLAGASRR